MEELTTISGTGGDCNGVWISDVAIEGASLSVGVTVGAMGNTVPSDGL